MRHAETKFLKKRIIKAIHDSGNTLTSSELRQRFPRASACFITDVARLNKIKLPTSCYVTEPEIRKHKGNSKEIHSRIVRSFRLWKMKRDAEPSGQELWEGIK